jgi:hypothetical protein
VPPPEAAAAEAVEVGEQVVVRVHVEGAVAIVVKERVALRVAPHGHTAHLSVGGEIETQLGEHVAQDLNEKPQ